MLTNCLAVCTHLSSTVSQLFELQVQKIAVFTYRSPHFCFPWRRPCDYHAICYIDGKTIQCLPNPCRMYLSMLNSFWVIRCLSQCVSPKIAILPHFCFSWGRPWGNHASVVWMEREFDAYKLSRCIAHLSITVSQIERDICEKIVIFSYPLHSTPPLGGFPSEHHHPVWYGKTRMVWLPDG